MWVRSNWTKFFDSSPTYAKGAPDGTQPGWQWLDPAKPMAAHPDQLWVDGVQLTQVGSRAAVTAGTFYVDQAAQQLVLGTNPAGRKVEASTLAKALTVRSTDSEIRGIGVRRYATSVHMMGSVTVDMPRNTLTDVTIRDNATTGFYTWALNVTLNRVSVINNGLLGAGASQADGLKITGLLSEKNNSQGFNRAPVSGALKVTRARGIKVTDSSFVSNAGQGPWFDESVYDITFTDNDVVGTGGYGLVIELSEKAVVANNLFANSGKAGIMLTNSGNTAIWNNTFSGNARGSIYIAQDARRASNQSTPGHDPRQPFPDPTMSWIVRGTVVMNNVVNAPGRRLRRLRERLVSRVHRRADGRAECRQPLSAEHRDVACELRDLVAGCEQCAVRDVRGVRRRHGPRHQLPSGRRPGGSGSEPSASLDVLLHAGAVHDCDSQRDRRRQRTACGREAAGRPSPLADDSGAFGKRTRRCRSSAR